MNRRRYATIIVMIGTAALARAQTLERQVIVPAGRSAMLPGGRISTSVGQIATSHLRSGNIQATQGFQQPYFQFGRLTAGDFAGAAGESRESDITLTLGGGEISRVSAIRLKLRFNATLLEPVGATRGATIVSDTIASGKRTVELLLPVQPFAPSPILLTTLRFTIGLGNDSLSPLEILDAVPVDGPVRFQSEPGLFTLLGICREGGPRLINPAKRATVASKPNPASSRADLEFELYETARTRLALVDLFGNRVATIVDEELEAGHYRVDYDVSGIPSGPYVLVLDAAAQRATANIIVQH